MQTLYHFSFGTRIALYQYQVYPYDFDTYLDKYLVPSFFYRFEPKQEATKLYLQVPREYSSLASY